MSEKDFPATYLNDKIAVAFFSTQMDATFKRGRVAFINSDGTTEVFNHEGLDVGRLANDGRNSVLVADRKSDTVIGAGGRSTARGRTEDVGFFSGWVSPSNGYLSLFNSGPQDNARGYGFNLDWYDSAGHHTGNIPYYLEVAGICDGILYTVGSSNLPVAVTKEAPVARLLRTRMAATASTEIVASWPQTATTHGGPVGQVFCHAGAAHFMYQSLAEADDTTTPWAVYLKSANLRSGKVEDRMVHQFSGRDEAIEFQTWHAYRSDHLHDGAMHYLDGQGRVFSTDLATGRVRQDVVLDIPHYQDGMAVTYWAGSNLYFLYQSHDLDKDAVLTCYDFTTGSKTYQKQVEGIGDLIGDGVYLKDLVAFE
ncbi:hypothetical protein FB565_008567 [Actinoplanes lutulentus]|uniref:Uncharacterized protein n=1 Tax=Actinoplanes lutulentus TaxID=1287878 RepID=A0A327Z3B2_9ACTN|nr:hypothetical protein [Actinoplanes lutulentus]MBB2948781.1 hypothetical protein [Actinoplanes lutulentus]RAK29693.1 hypothetical protein B0I29_11719 [Actinoplanes lutulentus]